MENFDVTEHFERCFVRQCFDREVHIRPLSQSPARPLSQSPARTAARGRTHGGSSLCLHTPRTGSSPPPRRPLSPAHFLPGSSTALPGAGHTPQGGLVYLLASWGPGPGEGRQGGGNWPCPPPLPPCPFSGAPRSSVPGYAERQMGDQPNPAPAGYCGLRSPPSWKPKPQRVGRGGEERVGRGVESRGEQRTSMEPCSRVRVAKCQMLATSLFVLVTGRLGRTRRGWGAPCSWVSITVGSPPNTHTHLPAPVGVHLGS